MGFLLELLTDTWKRENSFEFGKEVKGIHAYVRVSYFWTNLGEITMVEG